MLGLTNHFTRKARLLLANMENHVAGNFPSSPTVFALDDQEIIDNINGCLHGPMGDLIKKYFGNFRYFHQDASLEIRAAAGDVRSQYTIPDDPPSPDNFLRWFSDYALQENGADARGAWHIAGDIVASDQETNENTDGVRLFLTLPSRSTSSNIERGWNNVQVVGQFYECGSVPYQHGLLRLCRSAQEVFLSQPTRLFLHGFYIRGSLIEFWVFDRSGLYCSDVFDVQKDSIQILSVLLTYQHMSDQDLGQSNAIQADKRGSYINPDDAVTPSLGTKLYLESRPFVCGEGLVGTGTTCYWARRLDQDQWHLVVKFKWRWARERPEDELLRLVQEKNVWGAVSLDYYKEFESTANLRRSLRWGLLQRFVEPHSSPGTQANPMEKSQGQRTSHGTDGLSNYAEETRNRFQNRILACIVTSPLGRPLHTFRHLTELLEVFRDAIKCHRSLYFDANLLHQDISSGNMIILDDQKEGMPKGTLIDLDSATEVAGNTETEPGITGTRPFMAIGVLNSECHTYRHDLESFLYVFLWTIISNHTDNPPEASKLRQWSNGDWNELAARKSFDVEKGFQDVLAEFTPEFCSLKPLVETLRQIIFPLRDGAIWTGSDSSPEAIDKLYHEMVQAFEAAISSLNVDLE